MQRTPHRSNPPKRLHRLSFIPLVVCLCVPHATFGQPAVDAPGFPSRAADLDPLPGFQNPPNGYGEVPFWWWTGDPLDEERLLWQIEQLHAKGISGMQVNYAHSDSTGWPTYEVEPPIFSDAWWDAWAFVAQACRDRDMGIGLSGYTIDWPNGKSLVSRLVYSEAEIQGREIEITQKLQAAAGETIHITRTPDVIAVRAYPKGTTRWFPGNIDLLALASPSEATLQWTPDNGTWEVWVYSAPRKPGTFSPIHPMAGQRVIEKFFQPFQDHAPGQSAKGLNYFFHDELKFGVGDRIWTDDLPEEFAKRKGYDLFDALPAMFEDIGPATPKYRLDFMDVKMQLAQERYFIPIFNWHSSRGMIYGCDQGSRGLDPMEFGDYFSAVRWYSAPGHDTPGGKADLIKGKVSSSIAHLYSRPRVWLEGYHSLGWGATPENLMFATRENYLYGCNLLNLHGLYYTTHGSFWEWAPPCYHFRMPYWGHMETFLDYFERLSYLMSQGVHQADVAVIYPVATGQADMGGPEATNAAFVAGANLMREGYDFIFIDDESIARASVADGRLHVSDAAYRVIILPSMRAMRWATLQKLLEFYRGGGIIIAGFPLPHASDRAGSLDPVLDGLVRQIFGFSAIEIEKGQFPEPQTNPADGASILLRPHQGDLWHGLIDAISQRVPRKVRADHKIRATHRRIGPHDLFFVMDAPRGTVAEFRATGKAELWDPWTGTTRPLQVTEAQADRTSVVLPLEAYEAQIVVFTPGEPHQNPAPISNETMPTETIALDGDWEFELVPTMDNRFGDFRLPITEKMIGPEARIFRHALETESQQAWHTPQLDDGDWEQVTHGYGRQFWILGPMPADASTDPLTRRLADLPRIDPAQPVAVGDKEYHWQPYAFSWRWGREGDPGHQGYHGLKQQVSDHFLCLGRPESGYNETKYVADPAGERYFLWTSVTLPEKLAVRMLASRSDSGPAPHASNVLTPAALFVNGNPVGDLSAPVAMEQGCNPILVRFDRAGRGYFVVRQDRPEFQAPASERTPLAMRWLDDPAVIRFDPHAGAAQAEWFRFTAPPGLQSMRLEAMGAVEAWADGTPMRAGENGLFAAATPLPHAAKVALRIEPAVGFTGGAVIPEQIRIACGPGKATLGDWSQQGVLENYSGGAWYRTTVHLTAAQAAAEVAIDLGNVVATAEVRVNGQPAGTRVAPPWRVDLSGRLEPGANRIEVLVYNTLANHYRTIPTRYRGQLTSGLLGPVQLRVRHVGEPLLTSQSQN